MKKQILIIEDNYYKFFATKQVLEAGLKVKVNVVGAENWDEIQAQTAAIAPSSIYLRPVGGIADLLLKFKKRRLNRRNAEITILVVSELDYEDGRRLAAWTEAVRNSFASAA